MNEVKEYIFRKFPLPFLRFSCHTPLTTASLNMKQRLHAACDAATCCDKTQRAIRPNSVVFRGLWVLDVPGEGLLIDL